MPTPERTTLAAIVGAAREIIEGHGVDGLSMRAVADRVGVRPPSLYKRVRDRDELVRLAAEATLDELAARFAAASAAVPGADPARRLRALARVLREFARERPGGYRLVFAPPSDAALVPPETLARASEPLLAIAAELAGPGDALPAARTLTAWATGFIGMELVGGFRLGGDVDAAFDYGLERLAAALAAPAG